MVLLRSYSHVKKPNSKGKLTQFTALRAVGLAVEDLHKKTDKQGLGRLLESKEALKLGLKGSKRHGDLEILQDRAFKKVKGCTLELAQKESDLAKQLVTKQRDFLADLRANIWHADYNLGTNLGAADLWCDLSPPNTLGVKGVLLVELKQLAAHSFEKDLEALLKPDQLSKHFGQVKDKHSEVEAMLLLAC